MKHSLALTCIGLMLAGCSTTTEISRKPREQELSEINRDIRGLKVGVDRIDGSTVYLDSAHLDTSGIIGIDQETGAKVEIPQRDMGTIYSYGGFNSEGAGKGALLGGVVGGALGLLLGAAQTWEEGFETGLARGLTMGHGPEPDPPDTAPYVIGGVLGGALFGGITGGLASSDYYTFKGIQTAEDSKPPKMVTLGLTHFQDETPEEVCIMWSGRIIWLPKSDIKIERDGEFIMLTVPETMLEAK